MNKLSVRIEKEDEMLEGSRMLYISGARLVADKQVRIASTKIVGIGLKKAIQLRYRLGISGNIKIKELTKYQIDQIEQMIGQDHVVHWELKRGERADIERLISISFSSIFFKMRLILFRSLLNMSLLDRKSIFHFFCSLPLFNKMPKKMQILCFILGQVILSIAFAFIFRYLYKELRGYMFVIDELYRAVAPFINSSSGGMFGESSPPPGPSNDWTALGVTSTNGDEDQPEAAPSPWQNRAVEQAGPSSRQWETKSPSNLNSSDWRSLARGLEWLAEPGDEASSLPPAQEPPVPQPITPNIALESSMEARIRNLENANSIFMDEEPFGRYWAKVKESLRAAPSQNEYGRILELENRDLQIREGRHEAYSRFVAILDENPELKNRARYRVHESFIDHLNFVRDHFDGDFSDPPAIRDYKEIRFLSSLRDNLVRQGAKSQYIDKLLGY